MTPDEARITAQDVDDLNRNRLKVTATAGKVVGVGLMVVAAVGVLAWLWIAARQQQLFGGDDGPTMFGSSGESISFTQRVDLFTTTFTILLSAVLLGGLGFGLRLVSDFTLSCAGGSLAGVEVGARVPVGEFSLEDGVADDGDDDGDDQSNWAP
jgi:hypothetical protein